MANDGANLEYVGGNLTVNVGNGGYVITDYLQGTLTTAAQPNITSVGTLGNANIATTLNVASSAVVANSGGIYTNGLYHANGTAWDFATAAGSNTYIQFSNGTDLAASANLTFDSGTNNLTVNGNIITGTGSGGNISGANNVTANFFIGDGSQLSNINGANVSQVATATHVTAGDQGNITSVGTLTSLTVSDGGSGNITADNVDVVLGGRIGSSGMYLYGDGSNITNVTATSMDAGNLTGTTLASGVTSSSLTSVGTLNGLTIASNSNITMSGSASQLSGANLVSASYLTGTLTTGSQPNVTSVGTLTSLEVAGDITSDNGNIVAGNIGNAATMLYGNGINISNIAGANVTGWVEQANVANVAYAVDAGNITGTTLASGVTDSSLTSVGTLGSLTVTGDISSTSGNITAGNIGSTGSTYLYGDGSNITGVTASSIDANNLNGSTLSSKVTSSSLTSVGTLNGLTATGTIDLTGASNVALGDISNVHVGGGTSGQYLQTNGSGSLTWSTIDLSTIDNGTSNVAVALNGNVTVGIAGSEVINVATTGLTVTGIITATGNITGDNIISNNAVIANSTTDATSAVTGAIKTAGGISAQGNIYTGHAIGFANTPGSNTSSAAYIQFNSGANSLDFIFN